MRFKDIFHVFNTERMEISNNIIHIIIEIIMYWQLLTMLINILSYISIHTESNSTDGWPSDMFTCSLCMSIYKALITTMPLSPPQNPGDISKSHMIALGGRIKNLISALKVPSVNLYGHEEHYFFSESCVLTFVEKR